MITVSPDYYPSTIRIKEKIILGKCNIRILNQYGQLENTEQEMNMLNINIVSLGEMRWTNNGDFVSDKYWIIYAGGQKNERRVELI